MFMMARFQKPIYFKAFKLYAFDLETFKTVSFETGNILSIFLGVFVCHILYLIGDFLNYYRFKRCL